MTRIVIAAALITLAGCATRPIPPAPDVVVYHGAPDPRYKIPPELRERHLRERQRREQHLGREGAFQAEARMLLPRMEADPHFGGAVFRSLPEPHAVVMFTGDAEARLRRYTRDPRYKAQRVELTLAQLERMKDAFGGQLSTLGLRCFSVDGDEERNTVTVGAPADELAKVRGAIAERRIKAPPKLRLKEEGCATFR